MTAPDGQEELEARLRETVLRADTNERELITRVNKPLHGCYKIAMLSLKGGVGKTTVTATLGATFASLRGADLNGADFSYACLIGTDFSGALLDGANVSHATLDLHTLPGSVVKKLIGVPVRPSAHMTRCPRQ